MAGLAGYLPAALAAALTLVPVVYVVVRSLGADAEALDRAFSARTVDLLVNSVGLAAAVSLTAVVISVPYAWLVTGSDMPGRRFFAATGPLPLVVPSYVGALIMLEALGPKGLAQDVLEGPLGIDRMPDIYGFFGSWLALTLFTYPYVLLLVTAAFKRIDPAMAEAARGLGHGPLAAFVRTTLPQLRPAILAGSLLCALYVLSDFGVVSLMRFDTFTIAIYTAYRSFFDASGAALLALMLIVLSAVLLVFEHKLRGDPRTQSARSARSAGTPVALGRWKFAGFAFCGTVFALAVAVPVGVLGYWLVVGADSDPARSTLGEAVIGSISASGYAALLAVVLALPIAYLAARRPGRAARAIESVATAGFALPGVVVALGLVFFATRFAGAIYQTLILLVLAYVIRFLPQAVGAARSGILRADPTLEEAARGLGHRRWSVFRRITLPLAAPGVAAGAMLVFLTAMKELPATLILKPIGFETLATRIWEAAQTGSYAAAAVPSLILIAISAVALFLGSSERADPGQPRGHD
ncbi:MAG: iron ABC transporter permease [Actinobacteria bacterium]|nr:iron ABC transporter permease [Actinomycetota bacterium]